MYEWTGCGDECELHVDGGRIVHYVYDPAKDHPRKQLYEILAAWVPKDLIFSKHIDTGGKFITRQRLMELYRK